MSEVKEKFVNLQIIQVPTYNNKHSVKTNFLNVFKIVRICIERIQIVIDYCKEIANSIDINNIIKLVLQSLNENKLSFQLEYQQVIDNSKIVTINEIVYKITRINQNTFHIEKDTNDWNVDKLGAFGKTLTGDVVYPKINTSENKVKIIFSDPPNENINIFII